MKIIAYTFRTFPEKNELSEIFGDVFVFGKLKEDLKTFLTILEKEKPDLVLGIATDKSSRVEPLAINCFNMGKILKNGEERINLFVPNNVDLELAKSPTKSFCNWTMYKIAKYLKENMPSTKIMFTHINPNEIEKLKPLSFA